MSIESIGEWKMAVYNNLREENSLLTADSVRQYLRDMGNVMLLSREGELALARKIERGNKTIIHALAKTQLIIDEILYLEEKIEENPVVIRSLFEYTDEQLSGDRLKKVKTNVLKSIHEIKKLQELSRDFETEIDTVFVVSFDGEKNLQLRGNVMDILGQVYLKIGQELNLYPNRQVQVVLLANQEFFDITGSPDWAGGVYEGHIKVPVGNYNLDILKIILCHEYVHAVIYDRLAHRCPWWLNEGLAQYFSGDEQGNKQKLELAAALLSQGNVPSLMALPGNMGQDKKQAQMAYSLALSGVHFFMEKFTIFEMQAVLDLMAEGKSLEKALEEITAFTFKEFEQEWKEVR